MNLYKNIENNNSSLELDERFKTVILLERHGESLGNSNRVILGHTDLDLSEKGYQQAERSAEFLSSMKIDAVYSSDLIRAHNTALPHAKLRGLPVIDTRQMREIYAGEWEGRAVVDIEKEYKDIYESGWKASFGTFCIPGGESSLEGGKRIHAELLRIAKENEGKCVLVASHAAVIRAFWGIITNTKPEDLAEAYQYPHNASISVVYFDGKSLLPGEFSHADHLVDLM